MGPNTQDNIDAKILRERIVTDLSFDDAINAANTLAVVLAFILFNSIEKHPLLPGWLILALSCSLTQWLGNRHFTAKLDTPKGLSRSIDFSKFISVLYAVVWASLYYICFDPSSNWSYLLLGITCSIVAGSVVSTSVYMPFYYYATIPLVSAVILIQLRSDETVYLLASGLVIVFYIMSTILAEKMSQQLGESLRLRFEKDDLLKQLEEKKSLAERTNINKSKFLATAIHDLRQPLHALGFFIDTIKSDPINNHHLFHNVDASIVNLDHLFDALLNISKLEAGVISVHKRDILSQRFLQGIADEFRPECKEKQLILKLDNQVEALFTDPDLLKRIIGNLLSNAVRYTSQGSVCLELKRHKTLPEVALLSIADTGIGIPHSEADAIFTEFYQLNNPIQAKRQGLGLGLAIVKQLNQLLGYEIKLWSQPGVGSRFGIKIPIGQAHAAMRDEPQASVSHLKLQGRDILVLDDDPDILDAMNAWLSNWGCKPQCFPTTEQALNHIKHSHWQPELIISDYQLGPGQNGIEAIDKIRQLCRSDIPAIIISGNTAADFWQQISQQGYPLLQKPLKPAELRLRIMHSLDMNSGETPQN